MPGFSRQHRLHYRWSQIEADRGGANVGSPSRPLPPPSRVLEMHEDTERDNVAMLAQEEAREAEEKERFAACAGEYRSIEYQTFCKNGCLKLTEIELYFLSSRMTKTSSSEWAVVYLGVGNCLRFRFLRDEFFPSLAVFAFDPLDEFYIGSREDVHECARTWAADGTAFNFYVRCFDEEADTDAIRKAIGRRKLLLISDIRGVAMHEDGSFDKESDNDIQWRAIQVLRPEASLVKFQVPDPSQPFYSYAPGVVLKQVFSFFGTRETRLLIEGVPEVPRRYSTWELWEKMARHNEHLRGLVYESSRGPDATRRLDSCFDCTVFWQTLSAYAATNGMDPHEVLDTVLRHHVYEAEAWCDEPGSPGVGSGAPVSGPQEAVQPPPPESAADGSNVASGADFSTRWWDVGRALRRGKLMEAVAALEAEGPEDEPGTDWSRLCDTLGDLQPELAERLGALPRPTSRAALLDVLGSLSRPFTLVRTFLNGLALWDEPWGWPTRERGAQEVAREDSCARTQGRTTPERGAQ